MQPTDTTFGTAFNPDVFRSSIRSTMEMGMPADPAERLTWHWNRDESFERPDPTGNPYDWTATPVTSEPGNTAVPSGSLVVPYALEFSARPAGSKDNALGEFDTSRAIITLLDEEFDKIQTADYAMIDGVRYVINFAGPPVSLFPVTVYQVYLTAADEA